MNQYILQAHINEYKENKNEINFIQKLLTQLQPKDASFKSDTYLTIFSILNETNLTVEEKEKVWTYVIDALNNGMLDIYLYNSEDLDEYLLLGHKILKHAHPKELTWFLPIFVDVNLFQQDHNIAMRFEKLLDEPLPQVFKSLCAGLHINMRIRIVCDYLESNNIIKNHSFDTMDLSKIMI